LIGAALQVFAARRKDNIGISRPARGSHGESSDYDRRTGMASTWMSGKDRTKVPGAAVDRILSVDGVARREGRHISNLDLRNWPADHPPSF